MTLEVYEGMKEDEQSLSPPFQNSHPTSFSLTGEKILTKVKFEGMNNVRVDNCARHTVSNVVSIFSSHREKPGVMTLLYHHKRDEGFVTGIQSRTGSFVIIIRKI